MRGGSTLEITRGDIVIRDMQPSDIADHLRWRTVDTEWMNWDAPWQQDPNVPLPALEHQIRRLAATPPPAVRTRFEIALTSGQHIGWMNSYLVDGDPDRIAIGIDIAEPRFRGEGRGERAFAAFIHYLFSAGFSCVYTETWSGNYPMIRVAAKCGFSLARRGRQDRTVSGQRYDSLLFCVTPDAFYAKQAFPPTPKLKQPLNRCGWGLFFLILCTQLSAVPLAWLLFLLAPDLAQSGTGAFLLSALTLYGVGLPVFALIVRKVPAELPPVPAEHPDTVRLLKLLVLCLGMGYFGQFAGSAVISFLEKLLGRSYANPLDSILAVSSPAAIFLFSVVLAPLFEELMFRRILLSRLLPYGQEFAINCSALAFAFFHCNIDQFFYTYAIGAILAYAVIITGRLHIGILLHACFNLIGALLLPGLLTTGSETVAGLATLGVLCLMAGSLVLFTRGKGSIQLSAGALPLSDEQKRALLFSVPGVPAFLLLTFALAVCRFWL